MNEVKELVEELRNKKSRDNRDLFDRSADMIEKLAKELCDKSGCHHKCHDTSDCVVEDEAKAIIGDNLPSALTNEEKVSVKEKQIEEMAQIILDFVHIKHNKFSMQDIADVVPKSEVEYMTKEEIVQIIGEADKYCKNTSCAKCKFNEIKTPYCWWYNIAEHIYTAQNTKNFDSRQTIEESEDKE